jgi:hypothetical protein
VPQGILGGRTGSGATSTQLHSREGILAAVPPPQALPKEGLWTGETAGDAFLLAMPRSQLHPAHVAFGLNTELSSLPLQMQGLGLLPSIDGSPTLPSPKWAKRLETQWGLELDEGILQMYPQLKPSPLGAADWSCPIRKLVFWGSSTPSFGPITPNPVVAAVLYNLSGVHPFILPSGAYERRADYHTPNGLCYYRNDSATWPLLNVSDVESQCSLRGQLYLLSTGGEAPISIQEPFYGRCNDIIDTPDAGGRLRSGETLEASAEQEQACGLLHRLTPALVATRGDTVPVQQGPLKTSSEGGDCHMGRLAKVPYGTLQGLQCATTSKDQASVGVQCLRQQPIMSFARAAPLTLRELVTQTQVVYRTEFKPSWPQFRGPAGVGLQDPEVSFGQLYPATLKEMLSDELLLYGAKPQGKWTGPDFWGRYLNGSLVEDGGSIGGPSTASAAAPQLDEGLWNQSDWVWSFLNNSRRQGNFSKTQWQRNRTQTCNASMEALLASSGKSIQKGVRRIALCAPAPTGDLATLCTTMTQFAVDVTQANCQVMGQGDCIANLGMFYLPYMWSSTNQVRAPSLLLCALCDLWGCRPIPTTQCSNFTKTCWIPPLPMSPALSITKAF